MCKVIVIKGSGEKAFCAGGDVRQVVELAVAGNQDEALEFFAEEYKLNHMIATLKTPFVAILNGITSKETRRGLSTLSEMGHVQAEQHPLNAAMTTSAYLLVNY